MDIAISGFKGGVGKTTTALHVAYFITERFPDESVLVVDYDSKNRTAINRAETAAKNKKDLPFKVVSDGSSLGLIKKFQHVVFDLPGSPEENKLSEICENVDLMILPSGINDRENIEPIVKVARDLNPKKYKILVTMAPPRPQLDGENLKRFFEEMEMPVFQTIIRLTKKYNHAANESRLFTKSPYDGVTDEILQSLGLK